MERKIEKLLRAYAKKRRGQAGESFKLDSETRRILQNEISGSAPSSEDDDETMSLWEVFRRYWAFFLGFAVCIFIVASFFLHPLPNAKKKEMLSMSSQTLGGQSMRQIQGRMQSAPLAKSEDSMTNAVTLSEKVQSQQLAFGLGGSGPITNQKSAPIAMSNRRPSADRSEAGSLNNASAPAPPAPETQSATLETREATPPPATMPPAPTGGEYALAPMPAKDLPKIPTASAEPSDNLETVRQFQSVQNVQNAFMNTVAPASQSGTVLLSFRVEQNGNVIRVVDQDGSVYKGRLNTGESEPNTVTASGRLVAGNAMTLSDTAPQNAPKAESPRRAESDKLSPSSPVYYSFRVGGMNQTLKQPVVFTATLIENLEVMKNTQVTFGMSANVAYGAALAQQMMRSGQTNQMQLPWSSLRIAGTAVVNRTNHIEINAAPVPSSSNGGLPK